MSKKILSILCIVIIFATFIGCGTEGEPVENIEARSVVEFPLSEAEALANQKGNITKQEAETLCRDVLGEKAEETGFPVSYSCIGAASADDTVYYVMRIAWLVEGTHWSYIGNCFVSLDGKEIYDGIALSGEYTMTKLRWRE